MVQCTALLHSALLHHTMHSSTVQFCHAVHSTLVECTAPSCSAQLHRAEPSSVVQLFAGAVPTLPPPGRKSGGQNTGLGKTTTFPLVFIPLSPADRRPAGNSVLH